MTNRLMPNVITPTIRTDVALVILEATSLAALITRLNHQPHEIAMQVFGSDLPYAEQLHELKVLALHHVTQVLKPSGVSESTKEYGIKPDENKHCTVGDLRKIIAGLPRDMPVKVPSHMGPEYYQIRNSAVTIARGKDKIKSLHIGD